MRDIEREPIMPLSAIRNTVRRWFAPNGRNHDIDERCRHLVKMAAESWEEYEKFEDPEASINGADMVDWFGMYREHCKIVVKMMD